MLAELRVRDLGVIADTTMVLGPGLTALTGETGAGKTLLVEAIELLLGGRADQVLVRPGANEAVVEGRFTPAPDADGDAADDRRSDEVVLARVLPASGRSRAYLDGRMTPLAGLTQEGERLVDIHGQHSHQSLLNPSTQRTALDAFGAISHDEVGAARRRLRQIDDALAGLGGDARARVRELDLLRFQVAELDAAGLDQSDEDVKLAGEEERLADAGAHRDAAAAAHQAIAGDSGGIDRLGDAVASLSGRSPLVEPLERLRALSAELADVATELRLTAETLEDDPERLAWIRARRQLLRELRRKYGEDLTDVMAFAEQATIRLDELASYEERAAALDRDRAEALAGLARAEAALGRARRAAAPRLAADVEAQLRRLAMPKARFEVRLGDDRAAEQVTWLLGANAGEPLLTLAKVASGGEVARTMLAVRLVLSQTAGADGRTLVFDEVDAGIGGEAAVAVGQALADLGRGQQVLVVTHLAQVAAFADHQVAVRKEEIEGRTVARVEPLGREARVVEVARMLSGQPDSATGRRHAKELLSLAGTAGAT